MSDETRLTVHRTTSYADRLRAYKVIVDGSLAGTVGAGQSVSIPMTPGRHTLVLQIDWCGSEEIPFEARTGEHVTFECGSSLAGWRVFLAAYYFLLRTQDYLWLRRAT
jgi:hypothetical protein